MEPVQSFAPLAARLAAHADEIRPADGAEANWANFMALFFCAILGMLIALCEALDARAAEVARLAASPRGDVTRRVMAPHPARQAASVAARAPRPVLVADVRDTSPKRDPAPFEKADPAPIGPRLAWSRPPGPAWAVAGRIAIPPKSVGWRPEFSHAYFVAIS